MIELHPLTSRGDDGEENNGECEEALKINSDKQDQGMYIKRKTKKQLSQFLQFVSQSVTQLSHSVPDIIKCVERNIS